jgi:hypothetical protein
LTSPPTKSNLPARQLSIRVLVRYALPYATKNMPKQRASSLSVQNPRLAYLRLRYLVLGEFLSQRAPDAMGRMTLGQFRCANSRPNQGDPKPLGTLF